MKHDLFKVKSYDRMTKQQFSEQFKPGFNGNEKLTVKNIDLIRSHRRTFKILNKGDFPAEIKSVTFSNHGERHKGFSVKKLSDGYEITYEPDFRHSRVFETVLVKTKYSVFKFKIEAYIPMYLIKFIDSHFRLTEVEESIGNWYYLIILSFLMLTFLLLGTELAEYVIFLKQKNINYSLLTEVINAYEKAQKLAKEEEKLTEINELLDQTQVKSDETPEIEAPTNQSPKRENNPVQKKPKSFDHEDPRAAIEEIKKQLSDKIDFSEIVSDSSSSSKKPTKQPAKSKQGNKAENYVVKKSTTSSKPSSTVQDKTNSSKPVKTKKEVKKVVKENPSEVSKNSEPVKEITAKQAKLDKKTDSKAIKEAAAPSKGVESKSSTTKKSEKVKVTMPDSSQSSDFNKLKSIKKKTKPDTKTPKSKVEQVNKEEPTQVKKVVPKQETAKEKTKEVVKVSKQDKGEQVADSSKPVTEEAQDDKDSEFTTVVRHGEKKNKGSFVATNLKALEDREKNDTPLRQVKHKKHQGRVQTPQLLNKVNQKEAVPSGRKTMNTKQAPSDKILQKSKADERNTKTQKKRMGNSASTPIIETPAPPKEVKEDPVKEEEEDIPSQAEDNKTEKYDKVPTEVASKETEKPKKQDKEGVKLYNRQESSKASVASEPNMQTRNRLSHAESRDSWVDQEDANDSVNPKSYYTEEENAESEDKNIEHESDPRSPVSQSAKEELQEITKQAPTHKRTDSHKYGQQPSHFGKHPNKNQGLNKYNAFYKNDYSDLKYYTKQPYYDQQYPKQRQRPQKRGQEHIKGSSYQDYKKGLREQKSKQNYNSTRGYYNRGGKHAGPKQEQYSYQQEIHEEAPLYESAVDYYMNKQTNPAPEVERKEENPKKGDFHYNDHEDTSYQRYNKTQQRPQENVPEPEEYEHNQEHEEMYYKPPQYEEEKYRQGHHVHGINEQEEEDIINHVMAPPSGYYEEEEEVFHPDSSNIFSAFQNPGQDFSLFPGAQDEIFGEVPSMNFDFLEDPVQPSKPKDEDDMFGRFGNLQELRKESETCNYDIANKDISTKIQGDKKE